FVSIFVKWIGTQPILKCLQHFGRLPELLLGFIQVVGQHIIIAIQRSFLSLIYLGEMSIVRYIEVDAIAVDGIGHKPMKCISAIRFFGNTLKPAIGHILQTRGYIYRNQHTIYLIIRMILARPPDTGTGGLIAVSYKPLSV